VPKLAFGARPPHKISHQNASQYSKTVSQVSTKSGYHWRSYLSRLRASRTSLGPWLRSSSKFESRTKVVVWGAAASQTPWKKPLKCFPILKNGLTSLYKIRLPLAIVSPAIESKPHFARVVVEGFRENFGGLGRIPERLHRRPDPPQKQSRNL
jgi:hypothetical protein